MNTGKRLTAEEALNKIYKKCEEKNFTFIGFNNEENLYKNNKTYLILKCNKCGKIWDTTCYDKLVNGNRGCPNCIPNKKLTEEDALRKIQEICKERDYTFLGFNGKFEGISTKLKLKCNKCGKEWNGTSYNNLKKIDRKSHTCGRNNPSSMSNNFLSREIMAKRLNKLLNNTNLEFISFVEDTLVPTNGTHVILKCNKCGRTMTYLYRYLFSKKGEIKCRVCEFNSKFSDDETRKNVIEKCTYLNYTFLGFETKDGLYDGKRTRLKLKCNKCGYTWNTTSYSQFIKHTIKCKGCSNSWKMEKEIETILRKNSIKYIHDCRSKILPWLKNKISMSLDFYLPDYNAAIECQGREHFESVLDFGGEKTFKETIERDKKKLLLCKEHDVKLLYYDSEHEHTEFFGEKVYNTEKEIINEVLLLKSDT